MAWYDPRTWFSGDSSETPGPTNRDEPQASLEQVEHELGPTLSSLHGPFSLAQTEFLNSVAADEDEENHIKTKILPTVKDLDTKLGRLEDAYKRDLNKAVNDHRRHARKVAEIQQTMSNVEHEVNSLLALWNQGRPNQLGLHQNVQNLEKSLKMATSIVVRATQRWDKHVLTYLKHHHVRYDRLQIQVAERFLESLHNHQTNLEQNVGKVSAAMSTFSAHAENYFSLSGTLQRHVRGMRSELGNVKTEVEAMQSELHALRQTLRRGVRFMNSLRTLDSVRV